MSAEQTYIKIGSTNMDWIEKVFLKHIGEGFDLDEAWVTKKYWLFGTKKYWVRMKPSNRYYENEIAEAVKKEDYKKAEALKKELEAMRKISF